MGDPVWPDNLMRRRSPWDNRVHAFRELGEVASQAVCAHSALTDRLDEPLPGDPECLACKRLREELAAAFQQPEGPVARWRDD